MRCFAWIVLMLACSSPAAAQEFTAGAQDVKTSVGGISARLASSNALFSTAINKMLNCSKVQKFYDPVSDSCKDGPGSIAAGTVAAFALGSCPAGWSAYAPAAGRVVVGVGAGTA